VNLSLILPMYQVASILPNFEAIKLSSITFSPPYNTFPQFFLYPSLYTKLRDRLTASIPAINHDIRTSRVRTSIAD